jgi:hypothetical protein
MNYSSLQFEILQLRQEQLTKAVEAIAVFLFSIFVAVFLPQLLFTYLYANAALTQEPVLLKYIPVASFVVGVGYFGYAVLGNIFRSAKIKKLSMQLNADGMSDYLEDTDLKEVQSIVDEILADDKPAKKTVKRTASKTATKSKKTAKK